MELQNTQTVEFKSKWQRVLSLSLALSFALALTACGGGGGGDHLQGIDSLPQLQGQVMDGYIQGATVCLDLNSNGACDTHEPSTVSGVNGAYTLTYNPSVSLSALSILANVPVGAIDQDAGQPVYTAYQMRTAAQSPAVVTPLTTLAVYEMKTSALTWAQAQQAVSLHFSGDAAAIDLSQNYVAQGNAAVHRLARDVASTLQTAALNGDAPAAILAAAYSVQVQTPFIQPRQFAAPVMVRSTLNDYLLPNNQP
ncbi:hypothetical protein [Limnohabitans sp. B9-3]|uniref:hypothetical protein n=1 Tax=Limnohabitans sp. B9-3 TaxID=1100707 RepID=UPI000C1E5405|nr:hypothetical protein [Limnohabitans sp. B9-3]PIT78682.1 hypothetical protein B9Z42_00865 [Limnohabitans sp. B9-3]